MDAPIYACEVCGEFDIKLWREYQTFELHLRCIDCLAKRLEHTPDHFDPATIAEDGTHTNTDRGNVSDSIGWWVPAVQIQDAARNGEFLFWGYTSCAPEDYQHWAALPLHAKGRS